MDFSIIRICVISAFLAASICCSIHCTGATLNVKEFGAAADGMTDDTLAIQKALDAASKIPGSFVYAPLGQYLITGTITVPANTTFTGDFFGPGGQVGTTLLATGSKGKIDGAGCIVLTAASGLKGMAIKYPEHRCR